MAAVQIVAILDVVGKETKLPNSSPSFTNKTCFRETGFLHAHRGNVIAAHVDLFRNLSQERGSICAR